MSSKPLIHFAHANGVPSKVYQKMFDQLRQHFDLIYVESVGADKRYPVTNRWPHLVDQVIDSIVKQSQGRKVIGLGHSLGSVLTLLASHKRPDLFEQVIMLDPPLILGRHAWLFYMAKYLKPKLVDQMTPAARSSKRRDLWESREQAATLLRKKGFYQHFDPECFNDFIRYGLTQDPARHGVTLTIPKEDEVAIFRANPIFISKKHILPKVKTQLIVGRDSEFLQRKFPHTAKQKLAIDFTITPGGHMFPLEHPIDTATLIEKVCNEK